MSWGLFWAVVFLAAWIPLMWTAARWLPWLLIAQAIAKYIEQKGGEQNEHERSTVETGK